MTTVDDLRAQRAKLDEQIKAAARAERLARGGGICHPD
jgi:hypothetical protein